MLPKTDFPNSSPSSVRAVLAPRRAELTINLKPGEDRSSELPRTAHADMASRKRHALPLDNFTVERGRQWVKR
jgi:hypothetical protein